MIWNDLRLKLSDLLKLVDKSFKQIFWWFTFWVECEVSRAKQYREKYYLDLVQFDENQQVVAKARWIIWDSSIWKEFFQKVKIKSFEDLKGYKFLFHWKLNFHYEYGFSISIDWISEEFILWQLKKTQDDIRKKLIDEKIYDKNLNLPLPYPPFVIAVISSSTSEGLKDFRTILEKSWYKFEIILYESPIHWNEAKQGVYLALKRIYKDIRSWKKIDFIAILRWGWWSHWIVWQNDEKIARWICYMPVPVIVAVWHTSDRYILDEVAKISAKTPSDAAYRLIEIVESYVRQLDDWYLRIKDIVNRKILEYKKDIDYRYEFIIKDILSKVERYKLNLHFYYNFIKNFSPEKLLSKWFALLFDEKWQILNRKAIEKLNQNDKLKVKIYDFEIYVKIIKKIQTDNFDK